MGSPLSKSAENSFCGDAWVNVTPANARSRKKMCQTEGIHDLEITIANGSSLIRSNKENLGSVEAASILTYAVYLAHLPCLWAKSLYQLGWRAIGIFEIQIIIIILDIVHKLLPLNSRVVDNLITIHYFLGTHYQKNSKRGAAIKHLNRVRRLDINFYDVEKRLQELNN